MLDPVNRMRLEDAYARAKNALAKAEKRLAEEQHELEGLHDEVRQQERVCERAAYRLERAQDDLQQMERELGLAGVPIPSDPPPRCFETEDMFGGGR